MLCYEDEGKISLKGISMKLLVLALDAQSRVGAEFKGLWTIVKAYGNCSIYSRRPILVNNLRLRIEPTMWLKLCVE